MLHEEEEGTNDVDKGDARKEDMVVFMRAMVFFFFFSLSFSVRVACACDMTFIVWHIIPFDTPRSRVILQKLKPLSLSLFRKDTSPRHDDDDDDDEDERRRQRRRGKGTS